MQSANLERGIQLYELGRYNDAIGYLKKALNENIDDFTAKYLLAQSFYITDQDDDALNLALEIRGNNPEFHDIYFLLSQIYLAKNNIDLSLKNIDIAINYNPLNENYFGQKAHIRLRQKKFKDALDLANKGLQIDAKSRFCLNARAIALTKLKRKDEVEQTIENILKDNPEDSHSHASVGWNYLENNNINKALFHFREALKFNPNYYYAREGMSKALKAKNLFYNLYLRYAFWISNKSTKNQWLFIIGIYLFYRGTVRVLSAGGLKILAVPVIILYLLFVLGSWIMEPISNSILMFDKYGKYLLDKNEKLSGQIFIGLLSLSLISFLAYVGLKSDHLLLVSLSFLASILPLSRFPLSETKRAQNLKLIYGSAIIMVALLGSLFEAPFGILALIVALMFVAYTWLGNSFED